MPQFIALCTKEAGKTIPDGVAEVREAVDFLRYYAAQARKLFAPEALPGPTGESNELQLHGRGVFVCISPWNFPLAIFVGQVAAALAAGNSVIAKPAEQTNLIGYAAVKLLHEAGVPEAVLQFLPGDGATVGAALTRDPRVAGVAFTGSTDTARAINRALAARDAAIGVLIAETGGQNALIADSSALPEQLVKDAIGVGLHLRRPALLGRARAVRAGRHRRQGHHHARRRDGRAEGRRPRPAVDRRRPGDRRGRAEDAATSTPRAWTREAKLIKATSPTDGDAAHGSFFAPRAYELQSLDQLHKEVFGPVLHVIRWKARPARRGDRRDQRHRLRPDAGHPFAHRRDRRARSRRACKVGNCYVNRNQIGAVVGVQPFGGQGLSGTGPKAGGPHYLPRFATEKTLTVNTTAAGGNASLLTLGD